MEPIVKRTRGVLVSPYDQTRQQHHSGPSQVQVDLEIAVMCLVGMLPVDPPHMLDAFSEPETFVAGAKQRIDGQVEDLIPQSRSAGQRRVSPGNLRQTDPRVEQQAV